MMLHEIMVTQCTDKALQALVVGNTGFVNRRMCQQKSAINFLIQAGSRNLYFVFFLNTGCYY